MPLGDHRLDSSITRRTFSSLLTAAAGTALLVGDSAMAGATPRDATDAGHGPSTAASTETDALQSELLFDLVLDRGASRNVGAGGVNRVVVAIAGGTFDGPKLKGTIVAPSGDWIAVRPDGSSVLDIRAVLQTHDDQKISMTCQGIAYQTPGGTLHARILPLFETGAANYLWLNNVVSVGVYRSIPGKVSYRVHRIL